MIDEASKEMTKKVISLEEFKASSIIFLYTAKPEEVQTWGAFDYQKIGLIIQEKRMIS